MNTIKEIEIVRRQLIQEINMTFDHLIQRLAEVIGTPQGTASQKGTEENYENVYPLVTGPAVSKGSKPTGVLFGQQRVDAFTWKAVATVILQQCIKDTEIRKKLFGMRDIVSGRKRVLLSSASSKMRSPVEICKGLYFETHYDAETLLRILITRILDTVHYDYSDISIMILNQ